MARGGRDEEGEAMKGWIQNERYILLRLVVKGAATVQLEAFIYLTSSSRNGCGGPMTASALKRSSKKNLGKSGLA